MKPKILFIMHMPPPIHGAAMVGQWIHDSKLINEEFDCHYINPSISDSVDIVGKYNFSKIRIYLSIQFKILRAIIKIKPDICYYTPTSHGLGIFGNSITIMIMKLCRRKIVLHLHNKGVRKYAKHILARLSYKFNFSKVKVILISKELFEDTSEFVKEEDVFFLPNGIPQTISDDAYNRIKEKRAKSSSSRVRFLFLSNMISDKGIWVLLDACKELYQENKDFECHYIGGWGDTNPDEFNKEIQRRNLENIVFVHGPKYGEDKRMYFTNSDVFVFPTFYHGETFGLVLLEAMEYGLPCISTYEGSIPSIIKNGENGFLVKQQDVNQLKDKMLYFIANPKIGIRMGEFGRTIFKDNFTINLFENNLSAILNKTLIKNTLREPLTQKYR